ncbi:MAG TPA: hypothetical protein PKW18_12970 [Candidatus Sumerlaeota bacterium]|nr:hypothetical protein [Candidatus Sumerlaeota bacterium]
MRICVIAIFFFVVQFLSAQQVNPGGGVYSMSDVPGLTDAIDKTITNAYKGADTGTLEGEVNKVGRQVEVRFPTLPNYPELKTNIIYGTVNIDPSGLTEIDFFHTFSNNPFVSLMPFGTNISELLTPVVVDVTPSGASFVVISSGEIVTNAYRVDWQAISGAGLSWIGDTLGDLGGRTNIYLNNGAQAMNAFYFPVNHGAGRWLAGDASGYGFWQDRTIANLTDGGDVFKRDGTILPTANWNMNGKRILNMTRLQVTDGAAAGRYLGCDSSGIGYWMALPSWSPAGSALNMNGYAISGVGAFTAAGASTLNTLTVNGAVDLKAATTMRGAITLETASSVNAKGTVSLTTSGGSAGAPKLRCEGYARFNGVLDARGEAFMYNGLAAFGNISSAPGVSFWASGGHSVCDRDIICGDYDWVMTYYPSFVSPWGNIIAQRGFYGSTLVITGSKTFRIDHPKDEKKYLFHASIESPKVELIYRGKTKLTAGRAKVNLNEHYGLIPDTLNDMLKDLSVCVYNNASWTRVRCAAVLSSVEFEIEAENTICEDEVEWMAVATRCDKGVEDYKIEVDK